MICRTTYRAHFLLMTFITLALSTSAAGCLSCGYGGTSKVLGSAFPTDALANICGDPGLLANQDASGLSGADLENRVARHCRNPDCVVRMMTRRTDDRAQIAGDALAGCTASYSHVSEVEMKIVCQLPDTDLAQTEYSNCKAQYSTGLTAINSEVGVGYTYELSQFTRLIRYKCNNGIALTKLVSLDEPHHQHIQRIDMALSDMFDQLCVPHP